MKIEDIKVVIRGGGDLASGIAFRLKRSGFPVIMTELTEPLVVRRTVSFAEAVYNGKVEIEGILGIATEKPPEAIKLLNDRIIPVVVDPCGEILKYWQPQVVVDAVMAKKNILKTSLSDAELVIGIGPGFIAGQDVHTVIETKRGHYLGRVIYQGTVIDNTGIPGIVDGVGRDRVAYSPCEGFFQTSRKIGEVIKKGDIFGNVDGTPVRAQISGIIRGLVKPGIWVKTNVKVGDIDPRVDLDYCSTISDKALAIGGGVLEAILANFHGSFEI